jgi:DNA-binding transcriptional ArsR family regulator
MAYSKAHKFDDAIHHFSLMCKALSHPARVMILKRLISLHGESAIVGDLTSGLPLSKQALSEHIRVLREMSIVICEVKHPYIHCTLNAELLNTYIGIFSLVTQAELKYDDNYKAELKSVGLRSMVGTMQE